MSERNSAGAGGLGCGWNWNQEKGYRLAVDGHARDGAQDLSVCSLKKGQLRLSETP